MSSLFSQRPFVALREGHSPIQHLPRLSRLLGGAQIHVKRDDLDGLGGGGSKLRKLEFLLGEALAEQTDTVITVGARQSNHARLTAAACARLGLACELVLTRSVPRLDGDYVTNGNVLLDGLFGAQLHDLPGDADAWAYAQARAGQLRQQGRRVYLCPLGGSSATGCVGYARAAQEIVSQSAELGIAFAQVVVPNGSGGTQAGLLAGAALLGRPDGWILGQAVRAPAAATREHTAQRLAETLALLAWPADRALPSVQVDDAQRGSGYGIPTDAMREAVRLLARSEGLLVDPVYGGKALAGVIGGIRSGRYSREQHVLLLLTGGQPGLFAYRSAF